MVARQRSFVVHGMFALAYTALTLCRNAETGPTTLQITFPSWHARHARTAGSNLSGENLARNAACPPIDDDPGHRANRCDGNRCARPCCRGVQARPGFYRLAWPHAEADIDWQQNQARPDIKDGRANFAALVDHWE